MVDESGGKVRVSPAEDGDVVASELLSYLRQEWETPDLAYVERPSRIFGGWETVIYGFRVGGVEGERAGPLILRLFHEQTVDGGALQAGREAAIQNAVAGLGYPCPRVLASGTERVIGGARFTIMERARGRPLLDDVLRPSLRLLSMPGVIADLHVRLHDLPQQQLVEALGAAGYAGDGLVFTVQRVLDLIDEAMTRIGDRQLQPAVDWLQTHRPPEPDRLAICHGDFHPINLLTDAGEVSGVIDWGGAFLGDPTADVANTVVTNRNGPVDLPKPLQPLFTLFRRWLNSQYLASYRRRRPVDEDKLRYYVALLCFIKFVDGYAAAVESADALVANPWALPRVASGLAADFRAQTGVALGRPLLEHEPA